ncbi:Hsp20 family protein [candidate division KSB1 bacterium]|jgi:HSP20 family molecular chaperone IbpA|nr:Hsp20 family protein [candidate division KSB1 bacterium]
MTQQDVAVQEKRENQVEQTRSEHLFTPAVDIYENDDHISLVADMPGVDKESVDITLENNILMIEGRVNQDPPEGYELSYSEYQVGDYQRSFRISDAIDRDKIVAKVKDGVLYVTLPKAEPAKARKIKVDMA